MKKYLSIIFVVLLIFTLASCAEEAETFKLENFTISKLHTTLDEKTQYDSKYNMDSVNTTLFADAKNIIKEYTLTVINKDFDTCSNEGLSELVIIFETNNGKFEITSTCYTIDGEDTVVALVNFGELQAYTEIELFDEIKERIN